MRKGKTTLCITTGEIFESAKELAEAKNLKYHSVVAVCMNRQPSHHGLTFCYMEDAHNQMGRIIEGTRTAHHAAYRKQLEHAETALREAQEAEARAHAKVVAAEQKLTALRAEINH